MNYDGVICGNSDMVLKQMVEDGIKVDLVLTDPPYNIGKDFGNNTDSYDVKQFLDLTKTRIEYCQKLLTDNGSIIWFGSHIYIGMIQMIMYNLKLYYRRMLIWHYNNGMSWQTKTPATSYEPFLWFSKNNKVWTYNKDDVRVPYKTDRVKNPVYKKNAKGELKAWTPNPNGALRTDIFEYPILAGKLYQDERTDHPTQKPEALITELIKAFCPKKDGKYDGVVLDPFLGSGTTAVCCEKLNKQGNNIRYIGIELEQHWCDVANDRLKNCWD